MENALRLSSSFLLGALIGFGLLWLIIKIESQNLGFAGNLTLMVGGPILIFLAQLFLKKVVIDDTAKYPGLYYAVFLLPIFVIVFGSLLVDIM